MPYVTVPYRSNGRARLMMARALSTVGTRHDGQMIVRPTLRGLGCSSCLGGGGGPASAPGPGLVFDTDSGLPLIPYQAAKRMGLGVLGATTTAGAAAGAKIGASVGSAIPVVGTAIGAILGGIGGAIASAFSRQDQEVQNFDQAQAIARANGPEAVVNIANKYLVLAGLFDLQPSQIKGNIPFYKQYGRMGEFRFVTDMMTRIYQAAQNGQITANDTPQSVYQNIVLPWMNSWGKGALQDSNQEMITWVLIGMIAEYVSGLQTRWFARGGQWPFASLPKFALKAAPPPPAPVVATPQPIVAPAPVVLAPPPIQPAVIAQPVATPRLPSPTAPPTCAAPLVWNGTQCVMANATATTLPAPVVPVASAPPVSGVPSGFNLVGSDASGAPVFASPQGVLYSWNGQQMVQFTGGVAAGSSVAAQVQAAIQNALAQGYTPAQAAQQAVAATQAQGQVVPPAIQAQAADQAAATASAPQVTTAGIAPSGMTGLLVAGATLLALAFATARPARPARSGRRA